MFVVVYLNNILIYSNIKKEHKEYIKKVLFKLKKAELKVKLKKSWFYAIKVKFLKYIVKHNKI